MRGQNDGRGADKQSEKLEKMSTEKLRQVTEILKRSKIAPAVLDP